VILAGVTAKHGVDGLQIATMMAGAMLLLLGIARLGAIIKFIPDPVIVGFTAGIGVIIWVGQWKDFSAYRRSVESTSMKSSGICYRRSRIFIWPLPCWLHSVFCWSSPRPKFPVSNGCLARWSQ
jgi:MFS superfamily sulfate permease-like transporter